MWVLMRVQAKTDPDAFRIISYNQSTGQWQCDCTMTPFGFCAHIDAVINSGERFMVHPEDRTDADFIASAIGPIEPPPDWQASWRRNKRWRGMPVIDRKPSTPATPGADIGISEQEYDERPCVVFTGQFVWSRNELTTDAKSLGWRVAGSTRDDTQYVVASDLQSSSNKVLAARRKGIPVIDVDEWQKVKFNPPT